MTAAASEAEAGLGRKELNRIVTRFLALRDQRLRRLRAALTHEQQSFFDLLPYLWHVNHPMLPGFVSSETPAGLVRFRPNREQLLLARRYMRGLREERQLHRERPIVGLYLMGSMGSLGQTTGSDLDFWLCHDASVDDAGRDALQRKARLLEEHAASLGLHAHFFLMQDAAFRDGAVEQLSSESSGRTQHTLLLEEFYRTGLMLAGHPLLWWVVPPEHEDDYDNYTRRLIEKRFVRADQWLDFGGLHELPAEEFFSVAHWQLFKGIDAPYKSLLKLMLLEAYAAEYPKVDWLCTETKRAVYRDRDLDVDDYDPYLLILQRITRYLSERNELERLQLARRAFYFKTGHSASQQHPLDDWRTRLLRRLCERWGWNDDYIARLDTRSRWKLDRVVEERDALVSELSRSYRLLTEFAREQDAIGVDARDLSLLGRKLYAALDKRPGKVDRVNPGISRDLAERTLWLRRVDDDPVRWQLFLRAPDRPPYTPVKTSVSLVEILTWLHVNGICERSTQIHFLPKVDGYGETEQDKILKALRKRMPREPATEGGLQAYAEAAHGRLSLWFVNVAIDPLASHVDAGYQLISERVDPLSFGSAHDNLVHSVEHLYTTSWGEVRIERHAEGAQGLLNCLCRYLDLFAPHAFPVAPLAAFSFSSTRSAAIARRVAQLVQSAAEAFHALGRTARFVVRIADLFYQLHFAGDRYDWAPLGDADDLHQHLTEQHGEFRATRIDRPSLPDSPLPALMELNEAGLVQVFYEVRDQGIQLHVLDGAGALFEQWVARADEYYLVLQWQRFLDSYNGRRQLTQVAPDRPRAASFARLQRIERDEWRAIAVQVPRSRALEQTELTLAVNPCGRLQDGFRLQLGSQEFDSLLFGDTLYREVAVHIRRLRRGGAQYPVYLTGVVGAEGDGSRQCGLVELLRTKQLVEQRLAEAMR